MSREVHKFWILVLAQRVKASESKPDDLSSIPGTHMVEEEDLQVVLCPLLVHQDMRALCL